MFTDPDFNRKIELRNEQIDRCEAAGNFAVQAYGLSMVCIKQSAVEWYTVPGVPGHLSGWCKGLKNDARDCGATGGGS